MAVYQADFDYTGKAPTDSFMETLIKDHAGFTNVKKVSTVIWKITTTQSQSTVESALETAIENNGKYTGGEITSVSVEKLSAESETAAGEGT